jgi:hypothetical protein
MPALQLCRLIVMAMTMSWRDAAEVKWHVDPSSQTGFTTGLFNRACGIVMKC